MDVYGGRNGVEQEHREERTPETLPPPTYIETACSRWDVDAGHAWSVLDRRLDTYEQAADALQGALRSCICPRVDGAQAAANACSRLLVLSRRIGSPSADAEVYETVVLPRDHSAGMDPFAQTTSEGVRMAVKVLAFVGDDSAARNNTEMGIAQAVSDLVRAGVSPYFPLVYGTTYCDAVAYAPGSLLGAAARDYDLRQQVVEAAPPSRRRQVRALVRTAPDLASLGEALAAYGLAGVVDEGGLDPSRPLPAHLLVSEMAWGDLSSVAGHTPLTADQWFGVVRGVLLAIGALQSHLSVVHNDLHFGNVLVAVATTNDNDDDDDVNSGTTPEGAARRRCCRWCTISAAVTRSRCGWPTIA